MTRKTFELFGTDESRGVSPVIGVILMVAITVILAAVIGTFVLGLGENVSSSTPQASISFSDHPDSYDGQDDNAFRIEHNGGDELSTADMRITIRNESSNAIVDEWDDGWDNSSAIDTVNGDDSLSETDVFGTGDRITITDDSGDFDDDTEYTISVIDRESGQAIAQGTVRLR